MQVIFTLSLKSATIEEESPHLLCQATWFDPFRPVLSDIPRKELQDRLRVVQSTVRRWISGAHKPKEDLRYPIERVCYEYVERTLQPLGIQVPDHPSSAAAQYAVLAPKLRAWIHGILVDLVEKEGAKPVARQLEVDPSTLRRWIADPESIQLCQVILSLEKSHPEIITAFHDEADPDAKPVAPIGGIL